MAPTKETSKGEEKVNRRGRTLMASALIGVTSLIVAACGSSGASDGAAAASRGGGSGQTFNIGAVLPLSGSGATYGQEDEKMIKLAVSNIESDHLIKGKLTVHYCDSQALPSPAVACAEKAASIDHAVALQTLFTAPVAAEVPVAKRNNMLEINVGASGPNLDGLSPLLFTDLPLGNQQVATYANWAVKKQGDKRWVVLYTTGTTLGEGLLKAIKKDVPADGGTVVKTVSVSPTATEYSSAENLIRSAVGSQSAHTVVYFAVSGLVSGNVGNIISALYAQGVHAQWVSYNGALTPAIEKSTGVTGFEYTAPSIDLAAKNKVNAQFKSTFKKTYPSLQLLDYFTEDYNGIWLIGDAIHYLQAHNKSVTGTNLANAMVKMGKVDVAGGSYAVHKGGTVTIPISILKYANGKTTTVYTGR